MRFSPLTRMTIVLAATALALSVMPSSFGLSTTVERGEGVSGGGTGVVGTDRESVSSRPAALAPGDVADSQNVNLLGFSDLGGEGRNGPVTILGDTAIVGTGRVQYAGWHIERYLPVPCEQNSVKLVDISNPVAPTVLSEIPLQPGIAAVSVDALRVSTPTFTGDLLAVALDDGEAARTCTPSSAFFHRGVAYYNITDPTFPTLLGRYLADVEQAPEGAVCEPGAQASACATSQHDVSLVQRADGRVLSLSTEVVAAVRNLERGDLRIVDVTDPTNPQEVGWWPPLSGQGFTRPASQSINGCHTFQMGHGVDIAEGGDRALLAYLDAGVYVLDIRDPSNPTQEGHFDYPDLRTVEGNAAHATSMRLGGRDLALVVEKDWHGVETRFRVDSPASIAGLKFGCEALFTLYDRDNNSQIYHQPNHELPGELAYVGRACPARGTAEAPIEADPLPQDPAGKIAVMDTGKFAGTQANINNAGCTFIARMHRLQAAGAIGVLALRVAAPGALSESPAALSGGGDATGIDIPMMMIDQDDGNAVRSTLCPETTDGLATCTEGTPVTGAMVDQPGEWGGLRVLNISDPASPKDLSVYRSPRGTAFPPPDLGIYSVAQAVPRGSRVFVAANADGLRVLDLSSPRSPEEIGFFIPADSPDPAGFVPAEAHVTGIAVKGNMVLVSDHNSGLYVVQVPGETIKVVSNLSMRYSAGAFRGKVGAARTTCKRDRKIVVRKLRPGPNPVVGRTKTNRFGNWKLRRPNAGGRFYGVAKRQAFTNAAGDKIVCTKDRSIRIRA